MTVETIDVGTAYRMRVFDGHGRTLGVFDFSKSLPSETSLSEYLAACKSEALMLAEAAQSDRIGISHHGLFPIGGVTPHSFGGRGNGTHDDTAAIEAWWAFATQGVANLDDSAGWNFLTAHPLVLPPGRWVYNGSGLDVGEGQQASVAVHGAGIAHTMVRLGAGSRLFNFTGFVPGFECRGVYFQGGLGAYKENRAAANVSMGPNFERCSFTDYTEAAIAFGGVTDRPRVRVSSCTFTAEPTSDAIGVILPPGGGHIVEHSWFNAGRYDIKLFGTQLGECHIRDNRFGRRAEQTGNRHNIWVVPSSDTNNSGRGIKLTGNMHGNENIAPGDTRVLVADEDTSVGSDASQHQHATTTSSKHLYGFVIEHNVYAGGAGLDTAYLVSYTNSIGEFIWRNYIEGTFAPAIINVVPGDPADVSRYCNVVIEVMGQNIDAKGLPPTGVGVVANGPSNYGHAKAQDGTWNGSHLILGAYHLWFDQAGNLRSKSSTPTSDTDGTVVGAQT